MSYIEIEILSEGIENLSKAIDCFADCELVKEEEFSFLEEFIDKLENRKNENEIKIKNVNMEVI